MSVEIEKKRRQIDRIDRKLVELIAERARLAKDIGIIKRRLGKGLSDTNREKEVVERMRARAQAGGLEPGFIGSISKKIIRYCKQEQRKAAK